VTVVTVAVLLWPLLRRDGSGASTTTTNELSVRVLREQLGDLEKENQAGLLDPAIFAQEQQELERRALEDGSAAPAPVTAAPRRPTLAVALGLSLPVLATALYLVLGSPAAFSPDAGAAPENAHAVNPQQIQEMVARLAERLQSNPDDGEGWLMLARSYAVLGRYPESSAAYGRASTLMPPNANLLADYADVMAMAQGRKLAGAPEAVIAQALSIEPNHIKSLALAGSVAFEKGDYASAVGQWQKILAQLPPDSPIAASIQNSIADAQQRAGGAIPAMAAAPAAAPVSTAPAPHPVPTASAKPLGAARVSGRITLDTALQAKLPANATVYVFARPAEGARMPLAMRRIDGARFPLDFSLDESMAMTPNATLANAGKVVIGARVSMNGDAIGKSGDLEGFSMPVAVGAADIKFAISSVRP
jgi:cytochrome c-type biogenesis protein CcmH